MRRMTVYAAVFVLLAALSVAAAVSLASRPVWTSSAPIFSEFSRFSSNAGRQLSAIGSQLSSAFAQWSSGADHWLSFASSHLSTLWPAWRPSPIPDAPVYRTAAVDRGDIVTTVKAAGTLNAVVAVEVGSQISGLVKELYVDFNSRVVEGQVIARVDPEMYEARVAQVRAELEMAETLISVQRNQIERARAELESAESRYASARAESNRSEIAVTAATQDLERKRPLSQRNVISAGDWEHVENAYKTAQAQRVAAHAEEQSHAAALRAAQAALRTTEAQLANSQAQVKQREAVLHEAEIELARTYIRAPVTGTVVNRAVAGGQTLAASLQSPVLFTIAQDLRRMQVEASVVEADIGRFSAGQPVTFTVDAYPDRTFAGTVKQIRKAPQVVQNVVTYIVVISAENPDEILLPGMTANLQVVVAKRDGVLRVPNVALRYRPADSEGGDGGSARYGVSTAWASEGLQDGLAGPGVPGRVFVVGEGGRPKALPLRLGISDGRMTEVLAGDLSDGQPVITGSERMSATDADAQSVLVKFRLR